MPDLTDADRAAIAEAAWRIEDATIRQQQESIYRAGLAAGRERAAQVCDAERNFSEVMPMREPEEREYVRGWRSACWGCAAAIRALNASSQSK